MLLIGIPETGLLDDLPPGIQNAALPPDLIFQGPLHVAERVHILQFGPGAEFLCPHRPERNVGIAAQRAFLHVAVADFQIKEDVADNLEVCRRLFRRAQVRFADDLQERHAGAVKVHIADRRLLVMNKLARILFHVDSGQADASGGAVQVNLHPAVFGQRQLILGNLIALGKIRIKIILAGKPAVRGNLAIGGQPHFDGKLHHFFVEHRQHPRHAQADRTGLGIGRRPELGRTAAKDFAPG